MPKIAYRITDVRELPSANPNRRGLMDMLVVWLEDGARPYQLHVPLETYTPEAAKTAVEAEVRKHASIIGHEGTVEG